MCTPQPLSPNPTAEGGLPHCHPFRGCTEEAEHNQNSIHIVIIIEIPRLTMSVESFSHFPFFFFACTVRIALLSIPICFWPSGHTEHAHHFYNYIQCASSHTQPESWLKSLSLEVIAMTIQHFISLSLFWCAASLRVHLSHFKFMPKPCALS